MELVGGTKITDYCDRNQFTTRQRLDLFIQVCKAIQHAHQKGVIHRDIKPSNVLVAIHDGVAVAKVIDFGIAKATQGRLTDQTVFTAFEQFLGTPAYMSPEQTQPASLDVDTRSDIYSLGVLLYELLTGKTPFDTQQMLAGGLEEIRRTIREKEPTRPSTRLSTMGAMELKTAAERRQSDAPSLIHVVRGDLDWIVMKCMEKERARRYETVNGLARDVQRHLNNEPVAARPPSKLYEFQKTVRRHKFGFGATAAVIAALSCGIVATSLEAVRARRAEWEKAGLLQEARAARQDATEQLWASYLSQARALGMSGQAGRQFESLAALRKAAAIRPDITLRNEAIATMVLPDIQFIAKKGYAKPREQLAADPTLDHYAVCDLTGAVKVRRVSDDSELARLPSVGSAAKEPGPFSPDGKFLRVRYDDGHSRIWDWTKPAVLLDLPFASGLAFSPDKSVLAISDGGDLLFCSLTNGQQLNSISLAGLASLRAPGNFQFDPAWQRLALFETEVDSKVFILSARSGQNLLTLQHSDHVYAAAWHPDGKHLATGCADGTIHIWDTTSGEQLRMWKTEAAVDLRFNHRGDLLASTGWGGYMRWWEYPSGRQQASLINYGGAIISFGPDDRKLATSAWDRTGLDFFEVSQGQGLRTFYETAERSNVGVGATLLARSGRLLAYRTRDGVGLWDIQTGLRVAVVSAADKDKALIGFDDGDANLLLTGKEGLFRWPIPTSMAGGPHNPEPAILVNSECRGAMGCVSSSGKFCYLVVNNRCQIFRIDTFAKQAETGIQPGMRFVDISPDGAWVATGAWHLPGVRVWNGKTGEQIRELPTDDTGRDTATPVAFTPDGRYLVTAAPDEYCFWEIGSWSLKRRISDEGWHRMAFSRDMRIFAGTHSVNKVRLFNATTGEVLADLEARDCTAITGLAFNQDSTQLAVCESQDTLRVWDLRQVRRQLAELGLDWNEPRYSPPDSDSAAPSGPAPARTLRPPANALR
jgi:WD40 repeat protein